MMRPCLADAVVLASFGDASANHSTAQGAFNTAAWAAYQGTPMPLVFLCEDNGIGISTRTPRGWIGASFANRAGLEYIHCSGLDMVDAYRGAREAARIARTRRRPVFLHMDTVRLYGHAGSDVQGTYLSKAQIEADEERDPLVYSAALLVEQGLLSAAEILDIYNETEATPDPDRRAGDPPAEAHQQRRGDGEHRPAEARPALANTPSPDERERLVRPRRGDDGQAAAHGAADQLGARRSDAGPSARSSSPARMSGPRAASTTSPPSCTSASARRG